MVKPLLTRAAARAFDSRAIEQGVPGLVLMENAGRGAAEAIVASGLPLDRVLVVGGPGQNGGDGWVVARHLRSRGVSVRCVLLGERARVKGDARINLDALGGMGVTVECAEPGPLAVAGATLVVDALFGTGLDRPIAGGWAEAVLSLDECAAPVVSLDLPSGVDADTGAIQGVAVAAELTVTFGACKRGLLQHPGRRLAGEIVLAHLGVPAPELSEAWRMERADLPRWVGLRSPDAHKGTAGHVLVVAGSEGKTGAALLAGHAAIRAGAGLVTLASPNPGSLDARVVELMTARTADAEATLAALEGKSTFVLGPGLGQGPRAMELARRLALEATVPGVLDADALNAWASFGIDELTVAAAPRVLTPHPGEAARLLGTTVGAVQRDRYAAAATLAERTGQVVVLKGPGTIVASGATMRVCDAGTPALGVAGTGDVLAGVVGALLGQTEPFHAASAAVLWHALAGEKAARADRGLLAREVADALPATLTSVRERTSRKPCE